jgi:hypothetical protein
MSSYYKPRKAQKPRLNSKNFIIQYFLFIYLIFKINGLCAFGCLTPPPSACAYFTDAFRAKFQPTRDSSSSNFVVNC